MERALGKRLRATLVVGFVACVLLALGPFVMGQTGFEGLPPEATRYPRNEFEWARMIYAENPDYARGFGYGAYRWLTDAPEAETHLLQGIQRLTRINTASQGTAVRLDDDAVFDHPFLYAVEVGGWDLSP